MDINVAVSSCYDDEKIVVLVDLHSELSAFPSVLTSNLLECQVKTDKVDIGLADTSLTLPSCTHRSQIY